jgi:hypothetical protein
VGRSAPASRQRPCAELTRRAQSACASCSPRAAALTLQDGGTLHAPSASYIKRNAGKRVPPVSRRAAAASAAVVARALARASTSRLASVDDGGGPCPGIASSKEREYSPSRSGRSLVPTVSHRAPAALGPAIACAPARARPRARSPSASPATSLRRCCPHGAAEVPSTTSSPSASHAWVSACANLLRGIRRPPGKPPRLVRDKHAWSRRCFGPVRLGR